MNEKIRAVIERFGKLPVGVASLSDRDDLYRAGLTSHASVNLMLALEDEFDIEFPERMLKRQTFESIDAIREAIGDLRSEAA